MGLSIQNTPDSQLLEPAPDRPDAAADSADTMVAVLASLCPLTTELLARALLHERVGAPQLAGAMAVRGGVALISASAGS